MTTAPDILAVSAVPALHCDHVRVRFGLGATPVVFYKVSNKKLGSEPQTVTGSRRSRPRVGDADWPDRRAQRFESRP